MFTENRSAGQKRQKEVDELDLESKDLQIRVEQEPPDLLRQVIIYVLDKVVG